MVLDHFGKQISKEGERDGLVGGGISETTKIRKGVSETEAEAGTIETRRLACAGNP
jgi:hypothetical protein